MRERIYRDYGISESMGSNDTSCRVLVVNICSRNTYVETGDVDVIRAGENADALAYELEDMEKAIAGDSECMHFDYTKDVMDMMTEFRKAWKFTYPEEE